MKGPLYRAVGSLVETSPIDETDCLGVTEQLLTEALRDHYERRVPIILRGAVSNQQAILRWKDWDYLEIAADPNTLCHAEVGGNYTESERIDIHFGDYVAYLRLFEERYGRSGESNPPPESLVYLAQNDIIPDLLSDMTIPSFCQELGEGQQYSIMMWIGPYGCLSPLHFDPLDNALMQFVGSKRVLLYPPDTHLWAGTKGHQSNTSPFNPEEPHDVAEYPMLDNLPAAMDGVLSPGDVLFIPKKWWHHIRTIETSISVNAWWR